MQELDYKEFRMFAMACIDKQKELRESKKRRRREKRTNFCSQLFSRIAALFHNQDVDQNVTFFKEGQTPHLEKTQDIRKNKNTSTLSLGASGLLTNPSGSTTR